MLSDKNKKRLKFWFLKMPIFIGLFCLVMIAALKLVERYPDPLKEGFQKYMSQQTNTNTTVEQLEKAAFYPNIDIRIRNMTMHRTNNAGIIDMEAEKFFISIPLSGLFIPKGHINLLDVENIKALEGVFTPFGFHIKTAQIIDKQVPDQYGSFIIANGTYAEKEFTFSVEIQKKDKTYKIPRTLSFSLSIGDYEFNGITSRQDGNIILTNSTFQKGNQKSESKDYIFIEKNIYTTNNPLACLYLHAGDNIKQCDQYL